MAGIAIETASWSRRIVALAVDWLASSLVVILVIGADGWSNDAYSSLYVLGVYVLETTLFTSIAGGSFGKLATRLRTVRNDGDPRPLDLLRSLARSIMIAAVIPPLVFRPDGRGLHDIAAGTATVTLTTYRAMRGQG